MGNFGGEDRVFAAFGHATRFPFVGQRAPDGDGAHALLEPVLGIALGFVEFAGSAACQFRVCDFLDALVAHLRQPAFEGFSLGRGDGLDDAE